MTTKNINPWTAGEYAAVVTGSGAAKLIDSGIAPLVAAARGDSSFSTKEGAKAVAARSSSSSGRRTVLMHLGELVAIEEEDVMVIPWYSAAAVAENGVVAKSTCTQVRPSRPMTNSSGDIAKYETLAGDSTVLDIHPSMPKEFVMQTTKVLITEGVLKADSAVTAQLLSAGITYEQLAIPTEVSTARAVLAELLLTIPKKDRVLVVAIAGVGGWSKPNDWKAVPLVDRTMIIAFDVDVSTNWNVWNQANKLGKFIGEQKKGTPAYLNLASIEVELAKENAGFAPGDKIGLDDYLSKVGDWKLPNNPWKSFLSAVEMTLAPEPAKKDAELRQVGDVRVNPEFPWITEMWVKTINLSGEDSGAGYWKTMFNIAGRISSTMTQRRPTDREIETGILADDSPHGEKKGKERKKDESIVETVVIEITTQHPLTGDAVISKVTGPVSVLNYLPAEWDSKSAYIPKAVALNPEWPPRKDAAEFMKALKANRVEEADELHVWDQMSWVPVDKGHPAFVVGDQVLAQSEADEERTVPGVTGTALNGTAGSFGVIDNFRDFEDTPEGLALWKAERLADFELTATVYEESGVWTDPATAAVILAAMYRSTLPTRTGVSIVFTGAPGSGKTVSACTILGAWQPRVDVWHKDHMPGGSNGTGPAMEDSVSRTPIWLMDDLAPSSDPQINRQQAAAVDGIIRSTFNKSGRPRMSGTSGIQRAVGAPTALFLHTAENPPEVASIRERIILVHTPADAFGDLSLVLALNAQDGAPSRTTAGMIRFLLADDTEWGKTWAEKYSSIRERQAELGRYIQTVLVADFGMKASQVVRHSDLAADLSVSLEVLGSYVEWLGAPADHPLLEKLGRGRNSYAYKIFELAQRTVVRQAASKPGRSLVTALSNLLSSGRGHVVNPNNPGQVPVEADPADGPDAAALANQRNAALGWTCDSDGNNWRGTGARIGAYGTALTGGTKVVLFDPATAFNEAKKWYPANILFGQGASASWSSAWSEGLCAYSKTKTSNTVSKRLGNGAGVASAGSPAINGVPILFEALMNTSFGVEQADESDESDED